MNNNKRVVSLLSSIIFSISLLGQEITINRVSFLPNDKTALENLCLDNNGDTCALIKIKTNNVEGFRFSNPNQYIKTSYKDGVYWVYVPNQSRKLDFLHKDYMPVSLDMEVYGYRRLKKGRTYLVTLDIPRLTKLKSSVVIKVEPESANVIFDDKNYGIKSNGTFELQVSSGKHSFKVYADNYISTNNIISIGENEVKTIVVKLLPILHTVTIGSNVKKARVYVDNVEYGGIGKLQIPQGMHKIRVQADGYTDEERKVNITEYTNKLSFILNKNREVVHIHATEVRIISRSFNIYLNNKKIKEWRNGSTIMLLPGKYQISDDYGKNKIIEVGSEPMEIRL